MAITVWPKGFLTLESEDGTLVTWLYKHTYELEKYENNYVAIECHFGNKRGFITLSDDYIGQILELFIELKTCSFCGEYMPKDYEYCLWCDEWISNYVNKDKDRIRGRRRYEKHIKLKRKINLYINKKDRERTNNWLKESNPSKLSKWKLRCDCDYCLRGIQHSNLKRETRMIEYLHDYQHT